MQKLIREQCIVIFLFKYTLALTEGTFCNISTINIVFILEILYIAFHYVCINRHALNIVMQHREFSQELLPSFVSFVFDEMQCSYISHVSSSFCYSVKILCPFFLKGKSNFIVYFYIDFKLSIQTILEKTLLVVLSNKLFVTHMIVVKIQQRLMCMRDNLGGRNSICGCIFFLFCRMYRSHFYSPLMTCHIA